ncbi:MAG: tetratricopeptide repeat protein [Planctomycetota bacterium]|nr:MAG: tetratricopeptide repeat protein [Planctomycetota bacterium]REK38450.1 MAG: tetratricopeptide repeat protein [Planctomycetota bacterium]
MITGGNPVSEDPSSTRFVVCLALVLAAAITGCTDPDPTSDRGVIAYSEGDYDKAAAEFTKVIEQRPDFVDGYSRRGDAYFAMVERDPTNTENLVRAVNDYTKALELDSTDDQRASLFLRRGKAYLVANRPGQALADLNEVAALQSDNAELYFWRGDARLRKGDLEGALADWEEVRERSPEFALTYIKLAELYGDLKKIPEAAAAIEKYFEHAADGQEAAGHQTRGYILLLQRKFNEAVEELTKAVELNPNSLLAYQRRAAAQMELGNMEAALSDFGEVIRRAPNESHGYNNRAAVHLQQGRYAEAIADFTAALERSPGDFKILYNRGIARNAAKDFEGAVADYDIVIETAPNFFQAYLRRAQARIEQKDLIAALADLNTVVERAPGQLEAFVLRARVYSQQGNHEAAIKDLGTVVERAPSAEAYRERARIYRAAGEEDLAAADEAEADKLEGESGKP